MYGEVYIEYTPIGGTNMDGGIMLMDLSGSSAPGITEDAFGTTVNVKWSFPGGIVNQAPSGVGWGYALGYGIETTDELITQWLLGEYTGTRSLVETPQGSYTQEDIDAGNPAITGEINRLMQAYASAILRQSEPGLSYDTFHSTYLGCVTIGR